MNTNSISSWLAFSFALTLILAACTPATTPAPPTATFVPSSTPVPPTPTPVPTSTPALTLQCSLIKANIQQPYSNNIYGITGELVGIGETEIAALQIDIIGESGQITSSGGITTEADYSGNLKVKVDDEWTYLDSTHVYKIIGIIVYKIPDFQTIFSYDIAVKGDAFGTEPQTCKGS